MTASDATPDQKPTPEQVAAAKAKLASKGLPHHGAAAPEEPSPLKAEYERLKNSKGVPPKDGSTLVQFDTTTVTRAAVMKEIRTLIAASGTLFYFAGSVVEIVEAPLAKSFIDKERKKRAWLTQPKPLNPEAATAHIEAVARWFRVNADGVQMPKPLPDWSRMMLAKTDGEAFDPLNGIIRHPVVKGHAKIIGQTGYHRDDGFYIDAPLDLTAIDSKVRDMPLRDALNWLLTEWLGETSFDTPADGLRALMIPMTMLLAKTELADEGKWPVFIVSAPDAGTGKTELASSLIEVVTGRNVGVTPWGDTEEEMGKILTSISLADQDVALWDNLKNGTSINSQKFDAHVTSNVWQGRILGLSKNADVPAQTIHVLTGNNIEPFGDAHRRAITIRLVDPLGGATGRTFARPSLRLWTKANRPTILWCLLRLAAAKATCEGLTSNFHKWQQRVAAPLIALTDDSALLENWKERAPSFEGGAISAFLTALRKAAENIHHGQNKPLSASLLLMELPDETADLFGIDNETMAAITAIRIKDAPETASDEEKAETLLRREAVEKARVKAMRKASGTVALRAGKHKDKHANGLRLRVVKGVTDDHKQGTTFLAEDLQGKDGGMT